MQAVANPLLGAVAAFRYLLVFTVAKHTIAPRNSTGRRYLENGEIFLASNARDFRFCTTIHSFATGDYRTYKISPGTWVET